MLFHTEILRSHQDAFGMLMPSRTYQALGVDGYRFGFNGYERVDEVAGEGSVIDFGARIYDSRLGRWMSLDPLQNNFPFESNYTFVSNNPLIYIDKGGNSKWIVYRAVDEGGNTLSEISILVDTDVLESVEAQIDRSGGSDWYDGYNFYDINEVHTTIVKKDESTIDAGVNNERGAYRTSLPVNSQWLANVWKTENEAEIKKGNGLTGIRFTATSKGSKYQGNTFNDGRSGYIKSQNIDLLLSVLELWKPGGLKDGLDHLFESEDLGKDIEAVKTALSFMTDIMDTYGDAAERITGLNDALESVGGKAKKKKVCNNCDEILDDDKVKSHPTLNEGTRDTLIIEK